VLLAVFTVTTSADAGSGSLREAINLANATAEADEVRFDIPGPGVHTIAPASPLPVVTGPTTIDGRTQPGYAGAPLIELSGAAAGAAADGLVFTTTTGPGIVYGLVVNRFGRHGVVLAGSSQNQIAGCYVGTDAAGTAAAGNGGAGVVLSGGRSVNRSVISGNGGPGVLVNPVNVSGDSIVGNYIGTDATGAYAIGNGREGVLVQSGLNTSLRENVISGNASSGIRMTGAAGGISLTQNFIGTDAAGQRAVPNGTSPLLPYHDGVTVEGPGPVSIGSTPRGDIPGGRNVISGNVGAGISIRGGASTATSHSPAIVGNFIGTDSTGNVALGNRGGGIRLIGPTGPSRVMGNVISGNGGDGLYVAPLTGPTGVVNITGNYIGTNLTGTAPVGNGGDGVALTSGVRAIIGGTSPSPLRQPTAIGPITVNNQTGGNIISANGGAGVSFSAPVPVGAREISVIGNVIGSDVMGNADLGNGGDGVRVSGSGDQTRVLGNLISGNDGNGVVFEDSFGANITTIGGNYIGTNGAGGAALPNEGDGVVVRRSTGVNVGAAGAFVRQAFVNPAGTGRNVISGNRGHGVVIDGESSPSGQFRNQVLNNLIGTDAGGTVALGNGGSGVYLVASGVIVGNAKAGNVIAANGGNGVTIAGPAAFTPAPGATQPPVSQNVIAGNRIGTGVLLPGAAVGNLGNRGHGVAIFNSPNNRVGGTGSPTATPDANVIAFNGGSGVLVEADPALVQPGSPPGSSLGDANLISGNSIFSNARLGIDLSPSFEGVTPNDERDGDVGPNRLQNFPLITRATSIGASTVVLFTLNSEPGTRYRIEFFSSPLPDASGYGEGRTFLGTTSVTTDANGNASGAATLPVGVTALSFVTATATRATQTTTGGVALSSTSEFSPAVMARTDMNGDGRITALDLAMAHRALVLARPPAPATVAGASVVSILTGLGNSDEAAGSVTADLL
jgi:hypothetical protein